MRLLLANVAVFFLQQGNAEMAYIYGALKPGYVLRQPWTLVSYMFLHGSLGHIFFNMLSLWVFGPPLEARLGGRRFVTLYFISGLAGAIMSLITSPAAVIGASGAVFGVMLGFAWFWPRQQLMLWGIVGVEARWLIAILTALSLFQARSGDGIAHFAHLGGFIGAWLYLRWVAGRSAASQKAWRDKLAPRVSGGGPAMERWKAINPDGLHPVNREEYDRVMAKLAATGEPSLLPGEREFLDRFSQVH